MPFKGLLSPSAWSKHFLQKRDLDFPDGRPLYQYRVSENEYKDLQHFLSDFLIGIPLNKIHTRLHLPCLFVLYAAEWWRREYDGSSWSWHPILRSLGCASQEWPQSLRSECVTKGIKSWHLNLRQTGGYAYLSNIALQGGLPIRLLSEARGNVGRILKRTLDLAASNNTIDERVIVNWIESLAHQLPRSYRKTDIYLLFAQVIRTVLDLKNEAALQEDSNAVQILDSKIPSWRNRFPMTLDEASAKGLVDQLVKDAAKVNRTISSKLFRVDRNIINTGDGFVLESQIEFADSYIDSQQLKTFFSIDGELPRQLELCFLLDGKEISSVSLRKLAGHDKYRSDKPVWGSEGVSGCAEHLLKLRDMTGHEWVGAIAGGTELNDDSLWIFIPDGDNQWKFLRQFSGKIAAHEALIVTPKFWQCLLNREKLAPHTLGNPSRSIYCVDGIAEIINRNNKIFHIQTGQAGEPESTFEWSGSRIWEQAVSPSLAFREAPYPCQVQEQISSRCYSGRTEWRYIGGKGWATRTPGIGPIEMLYSQHNEVCLQNRMLLLPEDSKVDLIPGMKLTEGTIRFIQWGVTGAVVRSDNVESSVLHDGGSLTIGLNYQGTEQPPEMLEIDMYWSDSTFPAKVRYPFPAKGARLFNKDGHEFKSGCAQTVSDILGMRLLVFGCSDPIFSLDGGGKRRSWVVSAEEARTEIRLIDYESHIQELLAFSDNLDAHVCAELDLGLGQVFHIKFYRYSGFLECDGDQVHVNTNLIQRLLPENLIDLKIYSLRLDRPADEAEVLEPVSSEGVNLGIWNFTPKSRVSAPWIIYTGADSCISLRPLIWPFEYDEGIGGKLESAIRTIDTDLRKDALDNAIGDLAKDFLHEDWRLVEQLVRQLAHLPLSSLDIWKRISRSPTAMSALALRLGNISEIFFERFDLEFPFAWELIPATDWVLAMRCLQRQCQSWSMESVFSNFLESRIEKLVMNRPSLRVLLDWAKGCVTGLHSQEVTAIRENQPFDIVFYNQLFEGDQSLRMQLLRSHVGGNKVWPEYFSGLIRSACRDEPMKSYYYPAEMDYRTGIINLPIYLAVNAVTGELPDSMRNTKNIIEIRDHDQFDPEWFGEAFDLTIARCLACGLLRTNI